MKTIIHMVRNNFHFSLNHSFWWMYSFWTQHVSMMIFFLFSFSLFQLIFFFLILWKKKKVSWKIMENTKFLTFFSFWLLLNNFLRKFLTKSKTEYIPDILKKKYLKYYHLFFNLTKGEKLTFLCKDFFQKNVMFKNFSKEKFSTKLFWHFRKTHFQKKKKMLFQKTLVLIFCFLIFFCLV